MSYLLIVKHPFFYPAYAAMAHKYPKQQPFLTRYANNFLAGSRSHSQYNTFMEMFHVKQSLKTYDTGCGMGCLHNYKLLYIHPYVVFSLHQGFFKVLAMLKNNVAFRAIQA
jgi:hypothetical protein